MRLAAERIARRLTRPSQLLVNTSLLRPLAKVSGRKTEELLQCMLILFGAMNTCMGIHVWAESFMHEAERVAECWELLAEVFIYICTRSTANQRYYCATQHFAFAICTGAYGVVCSALNKETGGKVAIKKMTPMAATKVDGVHALREIRLMR